LNPVDLSTYAQYWLYTNHLRGVVDSIFRNITCAGGMRVLNPHLPSYNYIYKEPDATMYSHSPANILRENIVSMTSYVHDIPCLHSHPAKRDQRGDPIVQEAGQSCWGRCHPPRHEVTCPLQRHCCPFRSTREEETECDTKKQNATRARRGGNETWQIRAVKTETKIFQRTALNMTKICLNFLIFSYQGMGIC
jgi:hypothetical protein